MTAPRRAPGDVLVHLRRNGPRTRAASTAWDPTSTTHQLTYEELSAKGVEFIQPPSKRPYGVEALVRDNSGNWLVLVEPSEYTPPGFA